MWQIYQNDPKYLKEWTMSAASLPYLNLNIVSFAPFPLR